MIRHKSKSLSRFFFLVFIAIQGSSFTQSEEDIISDNEVEVSVESIHKVLVKWGNEKFSTFCIGTQPGQNDIHPIIELNENAKHTSGYSFLELQKSALLKKKEFNIGDVFYITLDSGLDSEWVSEPLRFKWENLGNPENEMTLHVETNFGEQGLPPFTNVQKSEIMAFFRRVNPIIKEFYGPPSRTIEVSIINGGCEKGVNMFFSGTNHIHMFFENDKAQYSPRLIIHELIHAYRDNVTLTNDNLWKFDPTLSGFEEGMAEAIALIVMNKFVALYPDFFKGEAHKIYWNHAYGMSHEWEYDFQNHPQLRNVKFSSTGKKSGSVYLRYAMAATAFKKMFIEDHQVFKKFNTEYYKRLNADYSLTPSRDLIIDIFEKIIPTVERTPVAHWIDKQYILDCNTDFEKKIFLYSKYVNKDLFPINESKIYFLETHQNGSELAWMSKDFEGKEETQSQDFNYLWMHQLNNIPGTFKLIKTWDQRIKDDLAIINNNHWSIHSENHIVNQKSKILLGPYQGPNLVTKKGCNTNVKEQSNYSVLPYRKEHVLGVGYQKMFISSIDQNLAFKNSSEKDVHLNAEASGLYQFDITFKDPKGPPVSENYFKLLGKEFINYSGVMGGVYNSRNTFISGLLLIEHEHFGSEAPLLIKNHAFASKRKWTGMMTSNKNRQGGNSERKYSYPGKIHLIYSSEDGKDLKIDFRTIGFGDGYLGSQMLLLNLDDFESIEFDIDIKKPNNINKNFVLIPKNNFPDILDNDDRISYVWIHPNGSIIGFQKNITLENFSNPDKGIYSLHIKFLNHFITKTVNIQPNISP